MKEDALSIPGPMADASGQGFDAEPEKYGWQLRLDELNQPGQPMPGPWAWEIHDHSMATLCGGGEDAIVGCIMSIGPCKSCSERRKEEGWRWGGCMTPSFENAQLITAAPDLLEALQTLLAYTRRIWALDLEDEAAPLVEACEAAIAKALAPAVSESTETQPANGLTP